jgi:hypothetical protein
METLSIQLSNLSEVSLRFGSDTPAIDLRTAQPTVTVVHLTQSLNAREDFFTKTSS